MNVEKLLSKELEPIRKDFLERRLPEHMWEGTKRYLMTGVTPGQFLTAVLENRLLGAIVYADEENLDCLISWVKFFHNQFPAHSWGSYSLVAGWRKIGGLRGQLKLMKDE